ncbi:hypothetical protein [Mesorhizobium sp. WSM2239]|uniref:Uncharacterized protein n=2 Tax=unclassified Mesorhizobium TaxID=325217 RepID=A0AAU8DK33_9HYPH
MSRSTIIVAGDGLSDTPSSATTTAGRYFQRFLTRRASSPFGSE